MTSLKVLLFSSKIKCLFLIPKIENSGLLKEFLDFNVNYIRLFRMVVGALTASFIGMSAVLAIAATRWVKFLSEFLVLT